MPYAATEEASATISFPSGNGVGRPVSSYLVTAILGDADMRLSKALAGAARAAPMTEWEDLSDLRNAHQIDLKIAYCEAGSAADMFGYLDDGTTSQYPGGMRSWISNVDDRTYHFFDFRQSCSSFTAVRLRVR